MQIFEPPANLQQLVTFRLPQVQTWGGRMDQEYKENIRAASGLTSKTMNHHQWFVFVIRCKIANHRSKVRRQIPDVENIPKLIVDAFTNVLYEDDNVIFVRGVQVEAELSDDETEYCDVAIYGFPSHGRQS